MCGANTRGGDAGGRREREPNIVLTVRQNPRQVPKVAATALGSKPQCTMHSRHFALPLAWPSCAQTVVLISSANDAA
jgi:hypothetical protein